MALPHDDLAAGWRAARAQAAVVHLDSAACARPSTAVQDAVAAHARHEADVGGYVAEEAAGAVIGPLRAALAALTGHPGAEVAFVEGALAAAVVLAACWPLPPGARIAVVPDEYGPNLAVFTDRGWAVEQLAVDAIGLVDLPALERRLAHDPPDAVHLVHVGSYDGRVQPAAEVGALCTAAGVPLWLDAAQSLGVLPLTGVPSAAVYGTSRKWLAGPRGVGFLVVDPASVPRLEVRAPALPQCFWAAPLGTVERMESKEAHIAGRVGLAVAVQEHLAAGPDRVQERLVALGALVRATCDGAGGWRVLPGQGAVATTTLVPPEGVDAATTRARLITERAVVVSWAFPWRAPLRAPAGGLRVSPHVDATEADLDALVHALAAVSR